MGYRRNFSYRRYNNYAMSGGYDSTGRWRSEAWHMDGGANDEGWHQAYCGCCGKMTEHGRQSTGNYCVPCDDRRRYYKKPVKKAVDTNPHRRDRWFVLKLYKVLKGGSNKFLDSLEAQNQRKTLTSKQLSVGAKILLNVLDKDVISAHWLQETTMTFHEKMPEGSIVRLKDAVNPMKVVDFDKKRNQILLTSLESDHTSWAPNDGRWLRMV